MTPENLQELRRLAPRLQRDGSFLSPLNDARGTVGLFVARNKFQRPVLRSSAAFLAAAQRADIVAPHSQRANAFILNDSGRACLRRLSATQDPFRAQHQIIAASNNADAPRALANKSQTGLDWLRHRQKSGGITISPIEFDAGARLRADYDAGQMLPHMCVDWSRPVIDGGRNPIGADDLPLVALEARRKFRDALEYVGGGLADILVQTCCTEVGLEQIEKQFGWPRRSGKLILKMGLNRLSVYYGLQSASAASASLRIR